MFYRTYLNCKIYSKFKYYCGFFLQGEKKYYFTFRLVVHAFSGPKY